MKRSLIFLLAPVLLLCSVAAYGEDYKFPPDLLELIEAYGGTEEPRLPDPKKVREEAERFSYPPGRMHLPVNVIVNKRRVRLYVVNVFGDTLAHFPVCCSANRGQKEREDDCRTPEGTFRVVGIYNSTDWRYKKVGEKCYGPYFISLFTPGFYGIGIHGTNAPHSVPGRSSHGCMRMHNEDITKLRRWVTKDTWVTVLPDDFDEAKEANERIRAAYVRPEQHSERRVTDAEVEAYRAKKAAEAQGRGDI